MAELCGGGRHPCAEVSSFMHMWRRLVPVERVVFHPGHVAETQTKRADAPLARRDADVWLVRGADVPSGGHTRLWTPCQLDRLVSAPSSASRLLSCLLVLAPYCRTRSTSATSDMVTLNTRNEFLGPDPRVVGYFVDADGDYHIRWYDTFLQDQWMDNRKWKFDVRQDEHGHWVDADD